jgi:23S rRNA (guanosine2251-2'-O)-methyltransferase
VEALRAKVPASALHVAIGIESDLRVSEAIKLAGDQRVTIIESSRAELDRFTDRAMHQGLALQIPPYEYLHPDDLLAHALERTEPALLVALDGVTDPRNLGAILRTAAAFGAHGVLVPERRAAGVTASAWKASAGAASRMPVARAVNLTRALKDYAKAGLLVVGLAADGDVELDDLDAVDQPMVLVVGSEGRGLSRLVGEACDLRVSIPMAGGNESLNAGIAGAVALYEIARTRRASP